MILHEVFRAGRSARVAKVLAFASFGLQSGMSCVHLMNYCVFVYSVDYVM